MPKKEISLLPKEEFEKKPLGKFLLWALTIGRWIVIVTELIVILAFLSRFKLDRDLADLYESIRAKQAIITPLASFEQDFRSLQNRLSVIDKLENERLATVKIITAVASVTPPDVALNKLSLNEEEVTLSGLALTETGLGSFLNGLSQSPLLGEINLSNVSKQKEGEGGIQFGLTAKLKKQGGKSGS